jgi:hypothetical protein
LTDKTKEGIKNMPHYELEFCFPKQPKIILKAFVSVENEKKAKDKFEKDYPNLIGCEILETKIYKNN